MPEIGMHEAKTTLSKLVERAMRGEDIVITRNGTPVVRLTPIARRNTLADAYGSLPGTFIDDAFDELPDDLAEAFGLR
ncbi:MAG: type II toxin-antitoxin system Phd/YefM family antitoxin [Solirubrobacteraceae bacterium]